MIHRMGRRGFLGFSIFAPFAATDRENAASLFGSSNPQMAESVSTPPLVRFIRRLFDRRREDHWNDVRLTSESRAIAPVRPAIAGMRSWSDAAKLRVEMELREVEQRERRERYDRFDVQMREYMVRSGVPQEFWPEVD